MTKPLDLSYVMQHALLAGQMGIRWENYDPTECSAYHRLTALQARCAKLEAAAREACEQLKSLAYASHKATGRPLSKRPRTKMLQRPEKVRDNLLAVRKTLRTVVDGGE